MCSLAYDACIYLGEDNVMLSKREGYPPCKSLFIVYASSFGEFGRFDEALLNLSMGSRIWFQWLLFRSRDHPAVVFLIRFYVPKLW